MIELKKSDSINSLRRQMAEAADRGKDPTPVLREIADDLRSAQATFLRNPRWSAPLSPEYAAYKARKGKGTTTGKVTGTMFNSLTNPTSPDHYERVSPDGVEVGSKNANAIRFNQGAFRDGPGGRQPKRKLYKLKVRDRKQMLARIRDYLLEPLR